MIKHGIFFVFLSKNTHKTHEIVKVAVISDKNNFAHLCFGHCVNSSVIVLDLGIFLRELRSLRKIPRSKTITSDFTQWPQKKKKKKKMVRSYYCVINNRYFDNFVCFMSIFLTKTRRKQHFFYHFCTHHSKWISISPDVTIIARCDKCANTGCILRDCLCVYAYTRMALAIMPTSHAEVIIRSHCYVIMTAQFFAPNWKQSTWIGSRYYAGY